jgi:hypothetical protein
MKKLILIALATVGVMQANAQLSINPEVGYNAANMDYTIPTTKLDTRTLHGLKIGATADVDIYKGLFFEPGIFYSAKGTQTVNAVTSILHVNYLEVPLDLGYRFDMGKPGAIFVTAGPYLGFGLNGHYKDFLSIDSDIKFGSNATEYKKLDVGMNVSLGYVSPIGIFIRGSLSKGFTNLSNVAQTTLKNYVWGVSVGYAFQLNER